VRKPLHSLAFILAFALASTPLVFAQDKDKEKPAPPAARSAMNATPLKVQVVIARYQGEKKISSMPYTLTSNANSHANLRMGTRIPVTMAAVTTPKEAPAPAPIQYQDVGTNIDCSPTALDDGRYLLLISLEDSSIYPDDAPATGSRGNPSFRSFRATNSMVLKTGETGQFTTATDKVTGETVKVDVTLTVLK
jgi:hypothetical protein